MKYKITVKTGNLRGAGTNAFVSIKLTGKDGSETSYMSLGKFFHDDFEKGKTDTYHVDGDEVGDVAMITLHENHLGLKSDWYVANVTVEKDIEKGSEKYEFPCYRWVTCELVVYEGKAFLPCSDNGGKAIAEYRKKEVSQNREMYKWGTDSRYKDDLPGFVEANDPCDLPKDTQFTDEATFSLFKVGLDVFTNLGLSKFFEVCDSWDSLDDFRQLITPVIESGLPDAAEYWRDDVWFGGTFLNGSNPEVIRMCKSLPKNFPVQNEMVEKLLDRGYNLNKAMKEGLIFIVDYKILEGVPTMDKPNDKRYISPAMGLFYLRKNDDMIPIAIQLGQQPGNDNPIWTPLKDTQWDWIMAKLWLRCADTQYHQMITHLLRCHLMMEPTAVASWRNLPSVHPVWKLLYPHTKGIMAINTLGRNDLIPEGGLADKVLSIGGGGHVALMQKYYRSLTFDSYYIVDALKDRGVSELRKFYYKDDATLLWNAVQGFVGEIIDLYYENDKDVEKDNEIQNWILDLYENGYKFGSGSVDKKVPKSFKNREELIKFLTMVIFTCSCQHAAVNFSQMATYGYHPNSPTLMRKPAPTKRGQVDSSFVMETLANKHQAGLMVATVKALTTVYPSEKFLGDYGDNLFSESGPKAAILKFLSELEKITEKIEKRNEGMIAPYTWLLPGRIPNSIAI